MLPYYLSIGMTSDEYWNGDCRLAESYRKAEQLRRDNQNQMLWLQGMYIYDAIQRLSPILRAFGKKGSKAAPYPDEPYPINKKQSEKAKENKEKAKFERGLRYMQAQAANINKQRKEEVRSNGQRNS